MVIAGEPTVLPLWPGKAPGEVKELPPEQRVDKASGNPVGGRSIIKLTNVSTPTLALYRPAEANDRKMAVIIRHGGGHHLLAMDHEGTEVAEWLNKQGITAVVLKYRVPARPDQERWRGAVQDAQRALRLVRHHAAQWNINPQAIGILGFSAGGETAARASLQYAEEIYPKSDEIDKLSARPDFTVLIYPAYLFDPATKALRPDVKPSATTPPLFLIHAAADPIDVRNSLALALELKAVGVPFAAHIFAEGGHGYGMRDTGHAVNTWPDLCAAWLNNLKLPKP